VHVNRNVKIAFVGACATGAFFIGLARISPNRHGGKLQEVQAVAWSLPAFSGFRELESSTNSGYTSAMVTRRFNCFSNCDAVVEYYSPMLLESGWNRESSTASAGETLFRRGDLSISISRSQSPRGYDYSIDVTWRYR